MIAICVGAALALLAMTAGLAVTSIVPLSAFPTIAFACARNGVSPGLCTDSAVLVGLESVAGFVIVLAVALPMLRSEQVSTGARLASPPARDLLLAGALALLAAHYYALLYGPVHASRLDESAYFHNFVSLENLTWPLLVHFFVVESDGRRKLLFLASLMAVMSLTPFRAVTVAIFVFAFAVPVMSDLLSRVRGRPGPIVGPTFRNKLALLLAVGILCAWGAYVDTKTRAPSLAYEQSKTQTSPDAGSSPADIGLVPPRQSPAERKAAVVERPAEQPVHETVSDKPAPLPPAGLVPRLLQRVAFPMYQAVIADRLSNDPSVPSLWDQFGRKFRLTSAPGLEEFLFRRIFGGEGSGQATSLYYGEAAVYMPGPHILWIVLGPLLIVAAAAAIAARGVDAGTLFGLALWRSSFSGLLPVLPALCLQLLALAALGTLPARSRDDAADRPIRWSNGVLLLATLALVAGQASLLSQVPERHRILVAEFSVANGCTLVSPSWAATRVDQAAHRRGIDISAASIATDHRSATIGVPYGTASLNWLNDFAGAIATDVHCERPTGSPVEVTASRILPWTPNPVDFAAFGLSLVALVAGLRAALCFRFGRAVVGRPA